MRDALLAAMTLDTFHRHADKVAMANIAQLVNCLQSLFLADGDRFVATPTFHVFEMYGAHVGGQSLRTVWSAPQISYDRTKGKGSVRGIAGSASLRDRTLTLTVVNPHAFEPLPAAIAIRGASAATVTASVLAAADIHDHNAFDRPAAVRLREDRVAAMRDGLLEHTFPPASVSRLTLTV